MAWPGTAWQTPHQDVLCGRSPVQNVLARCEVRQSRGKRTKHHACGSIPHCTPRLSVARSSAGFRNCRSERSAVLGVAANRCGAPLEHTPLALRTSSRLCISHFIAHAMAAGVRLRRADAAGTSQARTAAPASWLRDRGTGAGRAAAWRRVRATADAKELWVEPLNQVWRALGSPIDDHSVGSLGSASDPGRASAPGRSERRASRTAAAPGARATQGTAGAAGFPDTSALRRAAGRMASFVVHN
jgi:hypothetical protein